MWWTDQLALDVQLVHADADVEYLCCCLGLGRVHHKGADVLVMKLCSDESLRCGRTSRHALMVNLRSRYVSSEHSGHLKDTIGRTLSRVRYTKMPLGPTRSTSAALRSLRMSNVRMPYSGCLWMACEE